MAHEIMRTDTMVSVGKTPWHGLGKVVREAPNCAEAIKLAGLDWTVRRERLRLADGREVKAYAYVRDSDNRILGDHVGTRHRPLQNVEAFGFFDKFLRSGAATLETAGSLRNGERVWILAKVAGDPQVIVPQANDTVEAYILLANGHDGVMGIHVGFTPIRVVCANTLAEARSDSRSKLVKVRHCASAKDTLALIAETMDLTSQRFVATCEQYRALARKQISASDLRKFTIKALALGKKTEAEVAQDDSLMDDLLAGAFSKGDSSPPSAPDEPETSMRAETIIETVALNFESGRGNNAPGVAGTMWAAYNAVTEYITHDMRGTAETRLDSGAFGGGAEANRRAFAAALEMCK